MDSNTYANIQGNINSIIYKWRIKGIAVSDAIRSVLYLLALKKILKELEDSTGNEDAQTIIKLQNCLYKFQEGKDGEFLFETSGEMIEKRYHLQPGLFRDFFANVRDSKSWKSTLNTTNRIIADITDTEDEIITAIITEIMLKGFPAEGYRTMPIVSSPELAQLLKVVLNVEDGDTFLDGTVGCGISSMICIGDKNVAIRGMDSNIYALQIAALYTIISGKKEFDMNVGDFTLEKFRDKYNKIAMDIPTSAKTGEYIGEQISVCNKWMNGVQGKELDILIIAKVLDVLDEEGRAAIVIPNTFLPRAGRASKILKENILDRKMLKAVISLPMSYSKTGIKCSVLLLEKNDDKIMMIDIDTPRMPLYQKHRGQTPAFHHSGRIILSKLLKKRVEIEGVCALVDAQQVKDNQFDFSPNKYTCIQEALVLRDIQSINKELKAMNERLKEIEEKNSKLKLFN